MAIEIIQPLTPDQRDELQRLRRDQNPDKFGQEIHDQPSASIYEMPNNPKDHHPELPTQRPSNRGVVIIQMDPNKEK